MEPFTTAALIGGAASLISGGSNAIAQGKMNKRAERYAREMWDKQGQREMDYFNMQNAYNDPSAQMKRLQDAGLNPNLVYGSGAQTQSASANPDSPSTPNFQAPKLPDMGPAVAGVVGNALNYRQQSANIRRTEAETNAIEQKTTGAAFQNELNQAIGLDTMVVKYKNEADMLSLKYSKEMAEYNAWQAGSFNGQETTNPNSPIAKAIKAGYDSTLQNLKNSKTLGDIQAFEADIKKYQANLANQGIPPDSPWYAKIIGDLISKAMGYMSIFDMYKSVKGTATQSINQTIK